MIIYNVKRIFDNGEFISIETPCGTVHLPADSSPSITILQGADITTITVQIDLYTDNLSGERSVIKFTDEDVQVIKTLLADTIAMHSKVQNTKNTTGLSPIGYARSEYWYGKIIGIQDVLHALGLY